MSSSQRFSQAIYRNFCEVANAMHERQALISLEDYRKKNGSIYYHGGNFFEIAQKALFNDMISHIIKVLDSDVRSASFWYILRVGRKTIESCNSYSEEKIKFLENLNPKLKIVRDKTHFHIDEDGVLSPENIWSKAGITGNELGRGIDYLFDVLLEMRNKVLGGSLSRGNFIYEGEDVFKLLELARINGIIQVFKAEEEGVRPESELEKRFEPS